MKTGSTMKGLLLALLLTGAFLQPGQSQVVLYEDFNYTPPAFIGGNGNAGSTSNNWTTHSVTSGQTTTIDVVNGNLTYAGLPAPTGYKVSMFGNANLTSRDINRAITSTATALYFSVLLNVVDNSGITATGDYFMHFGATAGTSVSAFGARLGAKTVNAGANYRFMIQNTSGGTPTYTEFALDLVFGTTYLVVVKYDRTASPTMATLWVNPVSLGGAEPSGGVTNNSGTSTFATFASVCLRNNATTPKLEIDEIRVGPAWADVTPLGGTPALSVAPATLTGFQYFLGAGPSTSQSYNLSGSNLNPTSGNLTVTGATHFEVSLNNTTFSGSVTVPYTGAALAATPVYVRMAAGFALGNYNLENVANTGGGASATNVVCSGSVIKAEPTNHVTAFAAVLGIPSYSTINTSWVDATGATIPDGYLVKAATGGYASIVDPVDGVPEANALLVKNVTQGTQASAFTGIQDNTQFYFKIYPYTNSGTFINYKTAPVVPTASATTTLSPSTTYTWIGIDGAPWNVATNWSPTRTTPAINDILLFNGGGTKTVTAVPAETIGKIGISGNTTINLQSVAAAMITIMGVTGADLDIPAGSALNLNAANAITITLATTATASISGSMTFSSTVATAHRLTGVDANAITFNTGGTFTAGTFFSGNAFGNVTAGSVIFANGSTYNHLAGSNPFVSNPPASICVFQTGSLYKLIGNATPSFSGKTYANFEMDATGFTVTTTGGSAVTMDNLTVTNGTLNFNMTGTPGHTIKGNIAVATGGTLNFAPASAGTVILGGIAAQSISAIGTLSSTANSTLDISNATGVNLNTSIALNGNLKLTNGLLTLGSGNLLLGPSSAISGTPAATNMIVATGSGQLQKGFSTGFTGSFVYPVGDNTATAEFSPVTLTFTAGTFASGNYAGVNLVNAKYPGDPNTGSYLNRYWAISQSGITAFTCSTTFQYLVADVVGTESQIYCLQVLPVPFVTYSLANTTLHQLNASGLASFGTFTGSQPQMAMVTTSPTITNLTHISATGGGNVTSDGGSPTTARGLCYATTHLPTVAGPHTTETGGLGVFTSNMTGLTPQTTYYMRAYATNMVGTSYGAEVAFTTLCEPVPPAPNFWASSTTLIVGQSINFFDSTTFCPTSYNWSFVGGLPMTSTAQNPTGITYNYTGNYNVCLTVSNAYGTQTMCKMAYIHVTGPTNANIVMTEIMYNPPEVGVDSLEFIELYNNDVVPWDLQDFYFSRGIDYIFPSVALNPGERTVVAVNAGAMQNTFGINALQWTSGALSNQGEPIVLKDKYGYIIDSVYYRPSVPWDTLANGKGPSLELCNPSSNNTDPANWRHALEFANVNGAGDTIWASPLAGCSYPPAYANFVANDSTILAGQSVIFNDLSSSDANAWIWMFPGGTPDTFVGKTPPAILYDQVGLFDVILKAGNNAGYTTRIKSNYIQVAPTGISSQEGTDGFKVFPNPSDGKFSVVLGNTASGTLTIVNQTGNIVLKQFVKQNINTFEHGNLAPGIYLVRFTPETDGQSRTQKLIVK